MNGSKLIHQLPLILFNSHSQILPIDLNVEEKLTLFDIILGNLDLIAIIRFQKHAFDLSEKVESYMGMAQHGIFTITNEFFENGNYDELEIFAAYVINLRA